jgi:hypothetical protein
MRAEDFDAWAATEADAVESALHAWVPADAPAGLGVTMRYGVLDGGKRVRPLLVLGAAAAVFGQREAALRAACAVELIHAYSLVHDDMPCMDNDVLRRGKPTVHVRFGDAQAMLAGDAMQALAFEVLTPDTGVAPALQARLCSLLARAAGHGGMAGGQAIDLSSVGLQLDERTLRDMHHRKTGALLQASVLMGRRLRHDDAAAMGGAVGLSAMRSAGLPGGRRHPRRDPGFGHARQDRGQGPQRQQADLRDRARPRRSARHADELRARPMPRSPARAAGHHLPRPARRPVSTRS